MITTLRLQNFRSYKDASFEFDPNVNIIVGPNASGKTNLLEAIQVLASGGSYRARDLELVKHKALWAKLEGYFEKQARTVKLMVENEVLIKTFELDGQTFKRLSLERTFPVVLFEPQHLQLVHRGPQARREFFDDILERTEPGYKTVNARYRRVLAQRNALLKLPAAKAHQQLFAWDIRLSELGGQIAVARAALVEAANRQLSRTYGKIAGHRTKVELVYEADADPAHYSSRLLKKLQTGADKDLARGFTGHGPHREDIVVYLGRQPAATTASRGEVRSLLLALKIYELKLVEASRGFKPLFLLDDVFSELDGSRRRHLVEYLKGYQTIITTTDADAVMEYFSEASHVTPLK